MRIVLDTNVLVRSHGESPTLARHILTAILLRGHRLVLSNEILVEVAKVLRYPRLRELYTLTDTDLLEYTQFLQSIAELVALDPLYRAPLRDPSDLAVLQTAELGADILCTQDSDFFDPAVVGYCRSRGFYVLDELTALEWLLWP